MATSYRLSILFAGLALAAESLAVPVTGKDATITFQLGGFTISAGAGSVPVTGKAASLTLATPATWNANLGITALVLPSTVTAAGFTLLASGDRSLDFYGGFTGHQGMVYFPPLRSMVCFGSETHNSESYYANSPRIIELDTMKLSRALPDDPFANFRIDDIGIPWANAAHTAPWGMHGFRQQMVIGDEVWMAYDAIKHANIYQDLPGSIIPVDKREGAASTVRPTMWAFKPSTNGWRYIDGGANNANVSAMLGVGYGLVYSATRNSIMGMTGSAWNELSLSDFSKTTAAAPPISGFNNYSLLLNDGRVLCAAGGEIGTETSSSVLFSLVDPASPTTPVTKTKGMYAALTGLLVSDTPWAKLPSGRVIVFAKDTATTSLRPIIYDPVADTMTDSGHSLNVGATGTAYGYYWQLCDYAADFGQVILASNLGSLLRVWSYKPSAGV